MTWTISPTSAVMHVGDTVVFRVTSSAPPHSPPLCRLTFQSGIDLGDLNLTWDLDSGPSVNMRPSKPTTGACTVTLETTPRRRYQVVLQVFMDVFDPQVATQAYIEVEP